MQWTISRLYIVSLILTSTMCLGSENIYEFVQKNEKNFPCMKKPPSLKKRNEKTNYVKAIISNSKLLSSQALPDNKNEKKTLKSFKILGKHEKKLRNYRKAKIGSQEFKKSSRHIKNIMRRKRRKKRRNKQRHRRKLKNNNERILKHHSTSSQKKIVRDNEKNLKKIIKRSDFGCILDKSQLLIPNIQSRSRKIRATVKNSTSSLKKRQEYYDSINKLSDYNSNYLNYASTDTNLEISTDDMMLLDDYKLQQLSDNKPIGAYSFNRYPDKYYSYNSALQDPPIQYQNYDNNELINTRSIPSFRNQITTQTNLIANHTTVKQINHQSINLKKNGSVINRENETTVQTKQVASEILNEIIEQLEEIKIERNSNSHRDGLPCKITGLWKTSQAGVDLMIKITNHTLNVTIEKSHDVDDSNGLKIINSTWNITGHVAFQRGAPFYLIASNNHVKSLASFVGACKVCQGVDTIEGVWTIIHEPKTCRDFPISTNIYNDIFHKKIDNIKNKNTSGIYNETSYDTE